MNLKWALFLKKKKGWCDVSSRNWPRGQTYHQRPGQTFSQSQPQGSSFEGNHYGDGPIRCPEYPGPNRRARSCPREAARRPREAGNDAQQGPKKQKGEGARRRGCLLGNGRYREYSSQSRLTGDRRAETPSWDQQSPRHPLAFWRCSRCTTTCEADQPSHHAAGGKKKKAIAFRVLHCKTFL